MAEAIVPMIAEATFDKLAWIIREFAGRQRLVDAMNDLKSLLLTVLAMLNDAEMKRIKNRYVELWLNDLKDAAYDVDDLLDEFSAESIPLKAKPLEHHPIPRRVDIKSQIMERVLRQGATLFNYQLFHDTGETSGGLEEVTAGGRDFDFKEEVEGASTRESAIPFSYEQLFPKMTEIGKRLKKIAAQGRELGLVEGFNGASTLVEREALARCSPFDSQTRLYGRDKDLEEINKFVTSDKIGSDNVSLISISGIGGVGKTALARYVYKSETISDYFGLKAWVCVSPNLDLIKVTEEILLTVTDESPHFRDLHSLQVKLAESLCGKKFLLVLDDVWTWDISDWDMLLIPLKSVAHGSRVIVTTRCEDAPPTTRFDKIVPGTNIHVERHHLRVLAEEACWSLFSERAFGIDILPELEPVGKKLVQMCKGLPLAVMALGGLLRDKKANAAEWETLLNCKILDLPAERNFVLPSLKLSYEYLPAHLKVCFTYCAIFPKGYEFEKDMLVCLWMAEGFLQPKLKERIEDVGNEYFDDLVSRSFFQPSDSGESKFIMHDVLSDLAQFVSRGIHVRFDDNMGDCSFVRHLSYFHDQTNAITKFVKMHHQASGLRTLMLDFTGAPLGQNVHKILSGEVLHDLFSRFRLLRVLCLRNSRILEMPVSVGVLRHLRHLDLSGSYIGRLPNSVGTLPKLQTLVLTNCVNLIDIPSDIVHVSSLRHINISGCDRLQELPQGIGRLTNLQTLSNFLVGRGSGSGIRELKNLIHLRKTFCISRLENVVSFEDASVAAMKKKSHLHALELKWSDDDYFVDGRRDSILEEDVLNQLDPHSSLKELTVEWYGGTRFPSWLGQSSYSNLVTIKLQNCRKCELLPSLGHLSSLKKLELVGLLGVTVVDHEFFGKSLEVMPFQSLETLKFWYMVKWEKWYDIKVFPRLHELTIVNCPILRISHDRESPVPFPMLHKLVLGGCDKMILKSLVDLHPPLTSLHMSGILKLGSLPLEEDLFMQCLTSTKELVIERCRELVTLSSSKEVGGGLQKLISLQRLVISDCPQLHSLLEEEDGLPCRLEYLEIKHCHNLKTFPSVLPPTLRLLRIIDCKKLEFPPQHMIHDKTCHEGLVIQRH